MTQTLVEGNHIKKHLCHSVFGSVVRTAGLAYQRPRRNELLGWQQDGIDYRAHW